MRAVSEIAEWWDEQHRQSKVALDKFVDDNPNLFGIAVAGLTATAMDIAAGTVDVLRLGEGAAKGGAKGFAEDALRLVGVAGPLGRAAKIAGTARNARAAHVLVKDGPGPICSWIAATKALRQTGKRAYAGVADLAKELGVNLKGLGAVDRSTLIASLKKIGIQTGPLKELGNDWGKLKSMVRRDGSVVHFGVSFQQNGKNVGHALYAFYDHLGRFRIADRTGRVVKSLGELNSNYPGIAKATLTTGVLLRNAFMRFVGPKGTATLAVHILAALRGDPKTVAQAIQIRKDIHSRREVPGRVHLIIKGDTLSGLSRRYYGDMRKWIVLYEANREKIGADPNLIHPGQQLVIPRLPSVFVGNN